MTEIEYKIVLVSVFADLLVKGYDKLPEEFRTRISNLSIAEEKGEEFHRLTFLNYTESDEQILKQIEEEIQQYSKEIFSEKSN